MSLYDNASLVMIPSGVKEDKLYSIKPTDGSGDFTFSRGSDIQATRVNSSGLIEKAKVNLCLYSNTFDDASWATSSATLTSGQSGYDGSSDAWLLNATSGGGNLNRGQTNSGVHTFSIYAKKGTADGVRVRFDQTTDTNVYVDLRDGSVSTSGNTIDINIEDVSGGWYRVTFAMLNAGLSLFRIYPTDGGITSIAGSIYIQDAQLNHGLIAQDYVETTTTAVVEGLTADLPRLDYSGGASCPSLLLEPSRTNLFTQSEYFNSSDWTKTNATITSNAATSPEGVDNASLYTSSNATNAITDGITAANGTYTLSAFFKRDATDSVRMNFSDGVTGEIRYVFNLTDETSTLTKSGGTISDYSADFEDYGNGWYRLHITATTNSGTAITAYFETDNETGSFYLFGAQLEAGSYPTSYIPTYGTAANRGYEILSTPDLDAAGITTNPTAWTLIIKADYNNNGAKLGNNHTISRNEGGGMYRYSRSLGFTSATKGYWTEYNPSTPTAYIWDGTQLRVRRGGSDIRTISATNIGWNSGGVNNWTLNAVDIRRISMDVEQILIFNSVLTDTEIDTLTA